MRILAGKFHNQILAAPRGAHTRPTLSRVREALFNILVHRVPDSGFLDLYAGAGTIGFEALSRGSRRVVMVENHSEAGRALAKNQAKLDPEKAASQIWVADALKAAQNIARQGVRFDIIFLDPPYAQGELERWENSPHLPCLLADGGVVVVQHGRKQTLPEHWAGFEKIRERKYGDSVLTFFERTREQGGADGLEAK